MNSKPNNYNHPSIPKGTRYLLAENLWYLVENQRFTLCCVPVFVPVFSVKSCQISALYGTLRYI